MKQIFCDRCGETCSTAGTIKLTIPRQDEQGTLLDYQYEFDLCQRCGEEMLADIQCRMFERLKGGSECQTES